MPGMCSHCIARRAGKNQCAQIANGGQTKPKSAVSLRRRFTARLPEARERGGSVGFSEPSAPQLLYRSFLLPKTYSQCEAYLFHLFVSCSWEWSSCVS